MRVTVIHVYRHMCVIFKLYLLDVLKVNKTKFSNFNDDHTESAPPTSAAGSDRSGRVEGKNIQ